MESEIDVESTEGETQVVSVVAVEHSERQLCVSISDEGSAKSISSNSIVEEKSSVATESIDKIDNNTSTENKLSSAVAQDGKSSPELVNANILTSIGRKGADAEEDNLVFITVSVETENDHANEEVIDVSVPVKVKANEIKDDAGMPVETEVDEVRNDIGDNLSEIGRDVNVPVRDKLSEIGGDVNVPDRNKLSEIGSDVNVPVRDKLSEIRGDVNVPVRDKLSEIRGDVNVPVRDKLSEIGGDVNAPVRDKLSEIRSDVSIKDNKNKVKDSVKKSINTNKLSKSAGNELDEEIDEKMAAEKAEREMEEVDSGDGRETIQISTSSDLILVNSSDSLEHNEDEMIEMMIAVPSRENKCNEIEIASDSMTDVTTFAVSVTEENDYVDMKQERPDMVSSSVIVVTPVLPGLKRNHEVISESITTEEELLHADADGFQESVSKESEKTRVRDSPGIRLPDEIRERNRQKAKSSASKVMKLFGSVLQSNKLDKGASSPEKNDSVNEEKSKSANKSKRTHVRKSLQSVQSTVEITEKVTPVRKGKRLRKPTVKAELNDSSGKDSKEQTSVTTKKTANDESNSSRRRGRPKKKILTNDESKGKNKDNCRKKSLDASEEKIISNGKAKGSGENQVKVKTYSRKPLLPDEDGTPRAKSSKIIKFIKKDNDSDEEYEEFVMFEEDFSVDDDVKADGGANEKDELTTLGRKRQRRRLKAGESLQCQECDFVCKTHSKMEKHLHRHNNMRYDCSLCDASFKWKGNLTCHMKLHSGKSLHVCEICGHQAITPSLLRRHMDKHSREKFVCVICNKEFKHQTSLKAHEKIHDEALSYKCDLCGLLFSTTRRLEIHMLTHSDKRFPCDVCQKAFKSPALLKQHSRLHTKENVQKCPHCDKIFSVHSRLVAHMQKHTEVPMFSCDVCEKEYKHSAALKRHQITVHNAPGRVYVCSVCEKVFASRNLLEYHADVHRTSKSYICTVCNTGFRRKRMLQYHMRLHTGGTVIHCPECPKVLFTESHMKEHLDTHNKSRVYKCKFCDKRYKHQLALKRHEKAHQQPTVLHECGECQKMYRIKNNLMNHMKTHTTSADIFSCNICPKEFMKKADLDQHIIEHDLYEFHCETCGRSFEDPEDLVAHAKIHEESSMLFCSRCPKSFETKQMLKLHMMLHESSRKYVCNVCGASFKYQSNMHHHRRQHYSTPMFNVFPRYTSRRQLQRRQEKEAARQEQKDDKAKKGRIESAVNDVFDFDLNETIDKALSSQTLTKIDDETLERLRADDESVTKVDEATDAVVPKPNSTTNEAQEAMPAPFTVVDSVAEEIALPEGAVVQGIPESDGVSETAASAATQENMSVPAGSLVQDLQVVLPASDKQTEARSEVIEVRMTKLIKSSQNDRMFISHTETTRTSNGGLQQRVIMTPDELMPENAHPLTAIPMLPRPQRKSHIDNTRQTTPIPLSVRLKRSSIIATEHRSKGVNAAVKLNKKHDLVEETAAATFQQNTDVFQQKSSVPSEDLVSKSKIVPKNAETSSSLDPIVIAPVVSKPEMREIETQTDPPEDVKLFDMGLIPMNLVPKHQTDIGNNSEATMRGPRASKMRATTVQEDAASRNGQSEILVTPVSSKVRQPRETVAEIAQELDDLISQCVYKKEDKMSSSPKLRAGASTRRIRSNRQENIDKAGNISAANTRIRKKQGESMKSPSEVLPPFDDLRNTTASTNRSRSATPKRKAPHKSLLSKSADKEKATNVRHKKVPQSQLQKDVSQQPKRNLRLKAKSNIGIEKKHKLALTRPTLRSRSNLRPESQSIKGKSTPKPNLRSTKDSKIDFRSAKRTDLQSGPGEKSKLRKVSNSNTRKNESKATGNAKYKDIITKVYPTRARQGRAANNTKLVAKTRKRGQPAKQVTLIEPFTTKIITRAHRKRVVVSRQAVIKKSSRPSRQRKVEKVENFQEICSKHESKRRRSNTVKMESSDKIIKGRGENYKKSDAGDKGSNRSERRNDRSNKLSREMNNLSDRGNTNRNRSSNRNYATRKRSSNSKKGDANIHRKNHKGRENDVQATFIPRESRSAAKKQKQSADKKSMNGVRLKAESSTCSAKINFSKDKTGTEISKEKVSQKESTKAGTKERKRKRDSGGIEADDDRAKKVRKLKNSNKSKELSRKNTLSSTNKSLAVESKALLHNDVEAMSNSSNRIAEETILNRPCPLSKKPKGYVTDEGPSSSPGYVPEVGSCSKSSIFPKKKFRSAAAVELEKTGIESKIGLPLDSNEEDSGEVEEEMEMKDNHSSLMENIFGCPQCLDSSQVSKLDFCIRRKAASISLERNSLVDFISQHGSLKVIIQQDETFALSGSIGKF